MTGFDYIVFMVVAVAAIAGFFRGFVEEVLSLAAWCLALLAVHYFHSWLTGVLTGEVGNETGAGIIAFAILLAVPYFATKLVARQIGNASRASPLGPIDRVLGFGFGAIKGFVIMVLAFALVVFANDIVWGPKGRPAWIRDARTYPFLGAASDELMSLIAQRRADAVNAAHDEASDAPTGAAPSDTPVHHRHHHRPAHPSDE